MDPTYRERETAREPGDASDAGAWPDDWPSEAGPEYQDEPTVGEHPLAHEPFYEPLRTDPQTLSLPARREPEPSEAEEERRPKKKRKPKPPLVERAPTDISEKILWGGGAALIFSGVLSWLELATGVAPPEGLDQYLVALSAIIVGYLKKDRA
jgi:hypothetical protein